MEEQKKVTERLLLDLPEGRYDIVKITEEWIGVVGKTDEAKNMSTSELVKKALDDIISGRVTLKDIKAAKSKSGSDSSSETQEKEEKAEKVKK